MVDARLVAKPGSCYCSLGDACCRLHDCQPRRDFRAVSCAGTSSLVDHAAVNKKTTKTGLSFRTSRTGMRVWLLQDRTATPQPWRQLGTMVRLRSLRALLLKRPVPSCCTDWHGLYCWITGTLCGVYWPDVDDFLIVSKSLKQLLRRGTAPASSDRLRQPL